MCFHKLKQEIYFISLIDFIKGMSNKTFDPTMTIY